MKLRTFTVPFSEIVGSEATELEFDPATDYLLLRSIFAEKTSDVRDFAASIDALGAGSTDEDGVALTLDLLGRTVVEWHLIGPDGKAVPQPATGADLDALPGAIRGALFPFLASFRGKPDPTPAA